LPTKCREYSLLYIIIIVVISISNSVDWRQLITRHRRRTARRGSGGHVLRRRTVVDRLKDEQRLLLRVKMLLLGMKMSLLRMKVLLLRVTLLLLGMKMLLLGMEVLLLRVKVLVVVARFNSASVHVILDVGGSTDGRAGTTGKQWNLVELGRGVGVVTTRTTARHHARQRRRQPRQHL